MKIGQTVIVDRLVAGEEEALMAHTLIAFKEEVSALLLLVFFKCILSKVCLSKVYFCEMYPTCVSSKLCEFIWSSKKNQFLVINSPRRKYL